MKESVRSLSALFCFILLLVVPGTIWAAGGGSSFPSRRVDPDLVKANKAIEARDWSRAIDLLTRSLAQDADNPESYNLRGYSERMRGDLTAAFKDYERALALDPKHRGAHEYIGEAYLMVDNLAKAEEHLARLDKLCFFSCAEYRDLKQAIAAYKAKHPQ